MGGDPAGRAPVIDPELAANSPEDPGFSPPARPPVLHQPRFCRDCTAPVYWAATLDEHGQRVPRENGKGWRSMPVNAGPDPAGNVILYHREGQGVVCRVLHQGEQPPPGAVLRTSHFSNCPRADERRQGRRRR